LLRQVSEPRTEVTQVYLLYNITKAAVLHGTKLQAADPALTSRGITVVAECPGWCRVRLSAAYQCAWHHSEHGSSGPAALVGAS